MGLNIGQLQGGEMFSRDVSGTVFSLVMIVVVSFGLQYA
jgi:hypothetical protein